jgi:hypothetical protein
MRAARCVSGKIEKWETEKRVGLPLLVADEWPVAKLQRQKHFSFSNFSVINPFGWGST